MSKKYQLLEVQRCELVGKHIRVETGAQGICFSAHTGHDSELWIIILQFNGTPRRVPSSKVHEVKLHSKEELIFKCEIECENEQVLERMIKLINDAE